jgi:glutamyl-tRNA reductase
VLTVRLLEAARRCCAGRPLFLLDLAMPRDIEPACGHLSGVALADIEILGRRLAAQQISDDLRDAHRVIVQEAEAFLVRRRQAKAVPVIGAMRTRVQEVVDAELLQLDGSLADLDDRERTLISTAIQRAINNLMHGPTVRVKELSASPGGAVYVEALSRLFELNGSEAEI